MDLDEFFAIVEKQFPPLYNEENGTSPYDESFIEIHPVLSIIYLVVLCVFMVIGVIGNLLVIGAISVSPSLRTTGNLFIVNLAVADMCVTTIVDPFSVIGVIYGPKFFRDKIVICHIVASVCLTSCMCSMWNIAAIALNRYVYLVRNITYTRIYTWRKSFIYCLIVWAICATLDFPNYIGWGGHAYDMKTMACSYDRLGDYSYTMFFCAVAIGIPLSVVLVSYVKIFSYVRETKRNVRKFSEKEDGSSHAVNKREDLALAKTLFIVFIVFLILWSPYAALVIVDTQDTILKPYYVLVIQLAHTNSSINSILYAATNKRFRDGYKDFLRYCLRPFVTIHDIIRQRNSMKQKIVQ